MRSNPLPLRFRIKEETYLFRKKGTIRRTIKISSLFGRASLIASCVCKALPREKRSKVSLQGITSMAKLMLRGSLTIREIEERLILLYNR